MDDQRRAEAGRQRRRAGEERVFCIEEDRIDEQGEPERGLELAVQGPARQRHDPEREQAAGKQLPGAREDEVERSRRPGRDHPDAEGKGARGDRGEPGDGHPLRPSPQEIEADRQENVELLLDRERPGVEQHLHRGGVGEIACRLGVEAEEQVAGKERHRRKALPEPREIGRRKQHAGRQQGECGHHEQSGEDPADAALVEGDN